MLRGIKYKIKGKKSELEILGFSVFAIVVLVFLMCKLNPHKMCRYGLSFPGPVSIALWAARNVNSLKLLLKHY